MGNLKATMDAFRQQEQEMKSKQQDLKSSYEKKSKEIMNIQSRADNKLFLFGDKVTKKIWKNYLSSNYFNYLIF